MTPRASIVQRDVSTALGAFRTVLHGRIATYVAVPMTTGPRFFDWWDRVGSKLPKDGHEYNVSWRKQVWEPNLADAVNKIATLRSRVPGPIIDPTQFDAHPDWTQSDYHVLWSVVFREFVRGLILLDGWEFSIGCIMEMSTAISLAIPIVTERLETFDASLALAQIESAMHRMYVKGLPTSALEPIVQSIRTQLQQGSGK